MPTLFDYVTLTVYLRDVDLLNLISVLKIYVNDTYYIV